MAVYTKDFVETKTKNGVTYTLTLTMTVLSQNASTLKSYVSWKATLKGSSSATYNHQYNNHVKVTIGSNENTMGRTSTSAAACNIRNGKTVTLASWSGSDGNGYAISHNSDGTYSTTVKCSYWNEDSSTIGSKSNPFSVNGTLTIPAINIGSKIDLSEGATDKSIWIMDEPFTFHIKMVEPASGKPRYYHKLTCKVGQETYTKNEVFQYSRTAFTFAQSFAYEHVADGKRSVTMEVSVQSYTDSAATKSIGQPATCLVSLDLSNRSYGPKFDDFYAVPVTSNIPDEWKLNGTEQFAIKNESKIEINMSGHPIMSPSTQTLQCYVDSVDVTNKLSQGKYTTPTVASSGSTNAYVCRLTDVRKLSTEEIAPVYTVYTYYAPIINNPKCVRCNASGTYSPTGEYVKITADIKYALVGSYNNIESIKAEYKSLTESSFGHSITITSSYTQPNPRTGSGTLSTSGLFDGNILKTSSYFVKLIVTDVRGTSTEFEFRIKTDSIAFNLKDYGHAAAFGKYAEIDYRVDSAWDMSVTKGATSVPRFLVDNGNYQMALMIGSGGTNRGIYDTTNGQWMFYKDSDGDLRLGSSTIGAYNKPLYFPSGKPTPVSSVDLNPLDNTNTYVSLKNNDHQYASLYASTLGTTTTNGYGRLELGNNIAEGNEGNARGRIVIYGKNTRHADIYFYADHATSDPEFDFDEKGGIILTSKHVLSGNIVLTTSRQNVKFRDQSGNQLTFRNPPEVVASFASQNSPSNGTAGIIKISDISTTGFNIWLYSAGDLVDKTVCWIAKGF